MVLSLSHHHPVVVPLTSSPLDARFFFSGTKEKAFSLHNENMAAKLVEEGTGAENAAFGLSLGTKSEEDIIDIYGKRYDTDGSNIHREALRRCNQYLLGARREETLQVAWPIISMYDLPIVNFHSSAPCRPCSVG